MKRIHAFIIQVQKRMNRGVALRAIAWAALVASALVFLLAAVQTMGGDAADRRWMLAASLIAPILALVLYGFWRVTKERAACFADRHFALFDGIITALGCEKNEGLRPVDYLQREHTAGQIAIRDVREIHSPFPLRQVRMAAVLAIGAAVLAMLPESPERILARNRQAVLEEFAKASAKKMSEEIEELTQELTDEEKALNRDLDLAKEVKDLAEAKDQNDLLSKYAEIEKRVRGQQKSVDPTKDIHYLDKAANALKENGKNDALQKALKQREYKAAANELDKLKIPDKLLEQLKKDKDALSQQAQDELTGRAGSLCNTAMMLAKPAAEMKALNDAMKLSEMGKDCENLQQQAMEVCKLCDQLCKCKNPQEYKDSELVKLVQNANQKLDDLGKKLAMIQARQSYGQKLAAMMARLSQMQSSSAQACFSIPGAGRGGLQAGTGHVDSSRTGVDNEVPETNASKVDAQKGDGDPTAVTVEEASSGDGSARSEKRVVTASFRKQTESVIDREDIPEGLKAGVKNYFESVSGENLP